MKQIGKTQDKGKAKEGDKATSGAAEKKSKKQKETRGVSEPMRAKREVLNVLD